MFGRSWVRLLSGTKNFSVPRSCHVDQFTFHISLPTELTIYHLCLLIAKLYSFHNFSLRFILKIFLKFCKFQPRYSYKIYSYKQERVYGPLRRTAHELISANCFFNSLHKINIFFLLSRNLFTVMSGGQFQLSVHKSDVRNVNKCLPFARAFTEKGSRERMHQFIIFQ